MYFLNVSYVSGFDYETIDQIDPSQDIQILVFRANVMELNHTKYSIRWVITDEKDNIIKYSENMKELIDDLLKKKEQGESGMVMTTDDYFKRLLEEKKIPYITPEKFKEKILKEKEQVTDEDRS